jgi:hypothetical protein
LAKDEKGDFQDSQHFFNKCSIFFCLSLNVPVHEVSGVNQTKIYVAEPEVPKFSSFDFEIDLLKL